MCLTVNRLFILLHGFRFQRSVSALRKVPIDGRGSGGSNNIVTMAVNVRRTHLLMDGLKVFMDVSTVPFLHSVKSYTDFCEGES